MRKSEEKTLAVFYSFPGRKLSVREVARNAGLAAPTALEAINSLAGKKLLKVVRGRASSQVSANLENPDFFCLKRLQNLRALYACGLVQCLRDVFEEPECIVVFGSFSRGEDDSKSDADVAVVTGLLRDADVKRFERKLGRRISLQSVKLEECSKEFLNELANGVVLHGYLEAVK